MSVRRTPDGRVERVDRRRQIVSIAPTSDQQGSVLEPLKGSTSESTGIVRHVRRHAHLSLTPVALGAKTYQMTSGVGTWHSSSSVPHVLCHAKASPPNVNM